MPTRTHEATAIRDPLVALIRSDGSWQTIAGLPEMVWRRGHWAARMATLFDLSTDAPVSPNRLTLVEGDMIIFLVEWVDGGPLRVVAFERGAWEGKLLALPREA